MSSDEVFAAQMWTWPDPMIKRDSAGRVLFVNAAFLKMYGGQVQDWQGNTVAGWPAPQMSPVPNRFETRLPSAGREAVYDWLESMLTENGALAIARDVTDILPAPEPDPTARFIPPAETQHDNIAPTAMASTAMASTAMAATGIAAATGTTVITSSEAPESAADTETSEFVNPVYTPPAYTAPEHEAPVHQTPVFEPPVHDSPVFESPNLEPSSGVETPLETAPIDTQADAQTLSADAAEATPELVPAAATRQPEGRDYERRALPIENEDAVLGTNWRDAVIAKAVGSALPSEKESAEETQSPAAPEQPTGTSSNGTLRILLAEDNAINALLTRTLLEAEGCDVDVVEDGLLAVEAAKNQNYDMIFMDMRMPNMDGLESTRKIRALPNVPKSLPIVALTANAFDDDRNACFDSGMNDFMTKPVSAEELADMVKQWARKAQEAAA